MTWQEEQCVCNHCTFADYCPKCSKKLKKFINFERARNNKRRCDDE